MPSLIVRTRANCLLLPAVLTLAFTIHILFLLSLPENHAATQSTSREQQLVPLVTRRTEEKLAATIATTTPQQQQQQPGAVNSYNISSVDYMACCGAGHRLSKTADAHYLSLRLGFALRSFWGYCDTSDQIDGQTEVFQYVK